jgi:hypothetical protein
MIKIRGADLTVSILHYDPQYDVSVLVERYDQERGIWVPEVQVGRLKSMASVQRRFTTCSAPMTPQF